MTDVMNTENILTALKEKHRAQIWATELSFSSGRRRCDFWSLHPHASKGYLARAFEIKVSRSDFKNDTHRKQREARLFSDEFYYVTPPGLITVEEVPDWAGLWTWDESGWKCPLSAPRRDKDAPSWELVVSIMRYSGEVRRDTDVLQTQIKQLQSTNERLSRQLTGRSGV